MSMLRLHGGASDIPVEYHITVDGTAWVGTSRRSVSSRSRPSRRPTIPGVQAGVSGAGSGPAPRARRAQPDDHRRARRGRRRPSATVPRTSLRTPSATVRAQRRPSQPACHPTRRATTKPHQQPDDEERERHRQWSDDRHLDGSRRRPGDQPDDQPGDREYISSRFAVWSRLNSGHARLVGGLSAPWSAHRAVDGVRHPAGERIGRGKAGDHRAQVRRRRRRGGHQRVAHRLERPAGPAACRHSRRWRRVGHT